MKKEKTIREETEEVLRLMALGSSSDAVRLLMHSEEMTDRQLKKLNLMNVAGIKRSAGGVTEIKFGDRCKAVQLLLAVTDKETDASSAFIEALRNCVSGENEE